MEELRTSSIFKLEEIARWEALGQSRDQIAKFMDLSPDTVQRLMQNKAYRGVQAKIASVMYEKVDGAIKERKANVMLEEAAPDAAAALIGLLAEGLPGDRRQAATAVLDRAGFGPIQKRAVKAQVQFDPMTMAMLRVALLESDIADGDDVELDGASDAAEGGEE